MAQGSGLTKVLVVSGVCAGIAAAGNILSEYVTPLSGAAGWLVGPFIVVIVAMVTEAIREVSKRQKAAPAEAPRPILAPSQYRPEHYSVASPYAGDSRRAVRRVSTGIAVLIMVAIIVFGGVAFTSGVRYVVDRISAIQDGGGGGGVGSNQPGSVERLTASATGSEEGLTITVSSVQQSDDTLVALTVDNNSEFSASLPVYGYCILSSADGTTLSADPERSHWAISVPPGAHQSGTVGFSGHLPKAPTTASLSFTTVFGQGGGGSLTVSDMALSAVG